MLRQINILHCRVHLVFAYSTEQPMMSQSTNTRVALFPGPAQLFIACFFVRKAGLGRGTGFIVKRIVPAKMQPITSLYINPLPWRLLGRENTEEGGELGEKLCTNQTSLLNIQCFHTAKSTSPLPHLLLRQSLTSASKDGRSLIYFKFKREEMEECLETAPTLTLSHPHTIVQPYQESCLLLT